MTQVEAVPVTRREWSRSEQDEPRRVVASVPSGQVRTDRFLRFALVAIRVLNCSTSLVALITRIDHYRLPALVAAVYIAVTCWSAWLFGRASTGRMVTPRLAVADLATACLTLVVVGSACETRSAADWTNWSFAYALAVVLVAGAVLRPLAAIAAAAVLAIAYLGAVAPALTSGSASVSNAAGNALSFVGFALFAFVLARHLRRTGAELDAALDRALTAEAERVRYLDRIMHYRTLHNTVLSTLTGIARGGLEHWTDAVRARCKREADYLRRLIEGEDNSSPSHPLSGALEEVVQRAAEVGLRVGYLADALPAELPAGVVGALAGAAEEALENVRRHAGVDRARLTATGEDGQVVVRIVDQGHGFDPATTPRRFGLAKSIAGRLRDAGGAATIISQPGEGTWVELRWPNL